jgi:hypothetical protein
MQLVASFILLAGVISHLAMAMPHTKSHHAARSADVEAFSFVDDTDTDAWLLYPSE